VRHLLLSALVAVAALVGGLPCPPQQAAGADRIRVIATINDHRLLAEAVGGDLVEVDVLAKPAQNPDDFEVRPSHMAKVRRADLLLINGLDVDAWVEVIVVGANNPKVIPGAAGRVDLSRGISVLEVPTTRVDRSMGDVHPAGNPHYYLDPAQTPQVTATLVEALARVAPQHRAVFEERRAQFLERVNAALTGWTRTLEPFRGAPVVVYHREWAYLLARFGIRQVDTVEDRPGIPPSPGHLVQLIRRMRDERIRVILVSAWNDRRTAERVAAEAGAKVVLLAHGAGALKGTQTYFDFFDFNVRTLAGALQ
jgi:zinc/manganese transport system substrate-binding protein